MSGSIGQRSALTCVLSSGGFKATPIAPTHFELREDGTIAISGHAAVVEEIKTPPPKLTFADTERALWLYHGNCLELLDAIAAKYPEGRFDAIFADLPYFLSNGGISCHAGKMVKVDKGDWDKSRGPELNHEFNLEWLKRCQRVLKPNGTIWVSGTHHVIFSIGYAMQQLGFKILNDIAWEKPNAETYNQVREDYELVRKTIKTSGFEALTGKMGVLVQPRTKGAGHGSTSRAFYARTGFVAKILDLA